MMRKIRLLLAVLIGPAVMVGYALQEPSNSPEGYGSQMLKAQQAFRELLQRYPDSDLDHGADENPARGDFDVAQFYAKKGNYAGALSRLKTLIDKYPDFSRIDEVQKLYNKLSKAKQPSGSFREDVK